MKQEVRDYEALIEPQQVHGPLLAQEQAMQLAKQLFEVLKSGAKTVNVVAFNRSLFVASE